MIWRSKLRTSLHDPKEGMPLLTALIISAEKSALSMATLPIEIRPVPIQYLRGILDLHPGQVCPVPIQYLRGILGRGEGREMERHESAASLHLYFQDAHALGCHKWTVERIRPVVPIRQDDDGISAIQHTGIIGPAVKIHFGLHALKIWRPVQKGLKKFDGLEIFVLAWPVALGAGDQHNMLGRRGGGSKHAGQARKQGQEERQTDYALWSRHEALTEHAGRVAGLRNQFALTRPPANPGR